MSALGLLLAEPVVLTAQGAVLMALCVGLVLGLFGFCMYRILREPAPAEHHHAPLDIDTHDTDP
ncbi:MAG: hypothetical protein KKB50_20595 [Planctomycetes bacterium]|nr:hypothetical protein [Planctomycetota bacterium]